MTLPNSRLLGRVQAIAAKAGFDDFAIALFDYETSLAYSFRGDRGFHAASTIKVAFLLAVLRAAEQGLCRLDDSLHVRNRFVSVAGGTVFRVDPSHDGDASVHRRVGRTMSVADLARAMIVRSSNLATNLLFDFIGAEFIGKTIAEAGLSGIQAVRGVEDESAHGQGINNIVTADALVRLFRDFHEGKHLNDEHSRLAMEILFAQEFNSMIPARLPEGTKVAHKTGEISTQTHDVGIVLLPGRKPYVVAILTTHPAGTKATSRHVAAISRAVCDYLAGQS